MANPIARAISRIICVGLASAVVAGLYARYIEPKCLQVTHINMFADIDPITIAFVTDLHIGPHFSAQDLRPTIIALKALRPDIILFGGDFISESPRFLKELEQPLREMAGTARLGNWGVWGNHDIANIRERMAPVLKRCGVQMLTNQAAHLRDNLWVVGIDDMLLGKASIAESFANVPEGTDVIALWHEPDFAERIAKYKPFIMLSGHTHGGQVRLPKIGPIATPLLGKRFVVGHFDIHGMPLYVSRGIGMYRPPVRFLCRPELVVLHVHKPDNSLLHHHS